MRKFSVLAVFVLSLMSIALVNAASLEDSMFISEVEVNDQWVIPYTQTDLDRVSSIDNLLGFAVDEGEELEIEVLVGATETVQDVEVEAEIRGYEFSSDEDLSDRSSMFDMNVGDPDDNSTIGVLGPTLRKKVLHITLPRKLEKDRYLLRITIDNKDRAPLIRYVAVQIEPNRHGVDIKDVAFSPSNTVKAGRSLLTTVLLENYGDKDEKDVKVTVAIPELGLQATEFVDRVETDNHNVDYEDVAEMFLPIPANAEEKEYTVTVTVKHGDLRKTLVKSYTVNVLANDLFQSEEGSAAERLVLAVGPESQNVAAGKTAAYGIALSNDGRSPKAYTLQATTGDWATASLSDSLIVLESGKSKVVYLNLEVANDVAPGEHVASVEVKSGDEVLKTVALKANVLAATGKQSDNLSLRNGLEIALIVLVVLLVIIGLIVGFSRLRKDDEEEQTYY